MLNGELKKVFIKRYYLFVLLTALIAQIVFCFLSGTRDGIVDSFNKEAYESYVNAYSGELTDEKKELIEMSFKYLENAEAWREIGQGLLQNGDITLIEYEEIENQTAMYLTGRTGINVFREDYAYAVSKEGRQIVNREAWEYIFGNGTADIIAVLAVIVFTVSAFVAENETDFALIKNTTPLGRKKLHCTDLFIGMSVSAAVSLCFSAVRLFVGLIRFSVHDFSAPLESVSMFENTPFSGSVFGGYLAVSFLRAFGSAAFCAFSFILGNIFTSSVTVIMAGLLSVLLPQYVFTDAKIYYIPPISLMRGVGFLFGDVIIEQQDSLPLMLTEAAGALALPLSIGLSAFIIVFSFFFSRRRGADK